MKLWILLSVVVAVTLADRRRECETNSHWENCGTSCPLTCRNYKNPPLTCNLRCNAGCQCDLGYVLDEQHRVCIRPEDCSNSNVVSNCEDDVDPGPCWAYVESWYYNTRERRCMKFAYGGCQGNGNRYPTEEECNRKCRATGGGGGRIPDDICELPSETGNCRASITRYFFNKRSGKCETFVYGGCGGNANNFNTLQACQANCGGNTRIPDITTDTCDLPAETGNCRGSMTRYYFNRRTGQCETFVYGGCGGNSNNFQSLQACQANCGGSGGKIPDTRTGTCDMPAETGNCKGSFARYYFNRRTGQCEKFVYGGCGGNANNFERLQDCQSTCGGNTRSADVSTDTCDLPAETGNCRGSMTRYYFNGITGRCETFIYGGCGGNSNNFQSLQACQANCGGRGGKIPDTRTGTCDMPAETGDCKGSFSRYYFNRSTGQCEKFVYGGCGGNANNFERMQDCQSTCGSIDVVKICALPSDKGTCQGLPWTRYYFDRITGRCKEFIYRGCGGNENNFRTQLECQETCGGNDGKIPDTGFCDMPAETGECKGSLASYYFNRRTGQCEKFVYGGCGGNSNNFERLKDCQKICGNIDVVKICALPSDIGTCQGLPWTRYYFDQITGRCKEFIYRGCGGNENNFRTQLECQKTCGTTRS